MATQVTPPAAADSGSIGSNDPTLVSGQDPSDLFGVTISYESGAQGTAGASAQPQGDQLERTKGEGNDAVTGLQRVVGLLGGQLAAVVGHLEHDVVVALSDRVAERRRVALGDVYVVADERTVADAVAEPVDDRLAVDDGHLVAVDCDDGDGVDESSGDA